MQPGGFYLAAFFLLQALEYDFIRLCRLLMIKLK